MVGQAKLYGYLIGVFGRGACLVQLSVAVWPQRPGYAAACELGGEREEEEEEEDERVGG